MNSAPAIAADDSLVLRILLMISMGVAVAALALSLAWTSSDDKSRVERIERFLCVRIVSSKQSRPYLSWSAIFMSHLDSSPSRKSLSLRGATWLLNQTFSHSRRRVPHS